MAITVRTNEEQDKDIEKLKQCLGEKSATKALLGAASAYPKLKKDFERAQDEIRKLEYQLNDIKYSINNYVDAKERMLELAND